jgi:hypothetical protein
MRHIIGFIIPGIRLIVGNALILVAFVGSWLLYARFAPNDIPYLNHISGLLVLVGTPVVTTIHWIWSGISFLRMRLSASHLFVNLLFAELWPAFLFQLVRQQPVTDDATYNILGMLLTILLGIGMPLTVVVTFFMVKRKSADEQAN